MPKDYYQNILYPLQDKVLKLIEPLPVDFDTPRNILSNKISALDRLAAKDVVDIIYIAQKYSFDWISIVSEASQKDMWVNPVEVAKILDEFPLSRLAEIKWIDKVPDNLWFESQLKSLIRDLLQGNSNSLCLSTTS